MSEQGYRLDGIQEPVEVSWDSWGVPHIRAQGDLDLFFAQGFVAASQRLFQMDWWRRKGLGLMAEVLGPDYIERDRAARLLLYRGDMRPEWLSYGPRTQRRMEAFVAGINSWIARTRTDPALLAPEFDELSYQPTRWAAEDVVRIRTHGLYGNLKEELARAMTLHRWGPEVEDLRRVRWPDKAVTVPEGLDLSVFTEEVLKTYLLATGPAEPLAPAGERLDGSNNWVLAGPKTETGRPLLANDPHRAIDVPSLRYIAHLSCPEFDVIGAGEPWLPGISIGHNGQVSFGFTHWKTDQEDLYVYDLHPEDLTLYRYNDSWARMEQHTEEIPMSSAVTATVEHLFTRHGPVLHVDEKKNVAFALRAAWLEPGMAPYLGCLRYLGAANAQQVRDALESWGAPGLNHVQADAEGSIGWSPRALVPHRPHWDGMLPVPGDGRYEWDGFRNAAELPEVVDPEQGWFASANEYNLHRDPQWDGTPVGYDWFPPHRYDRIAEVLHQEDAASLTSMMQLQNDYVSMPARLVCEMLPAEPFEDDLAEQARTMLVQWDRRMQADSVAALVFQRWLRGPLRRRILRDQLSRLVPEEEVEDALAAITPDEDSFGNWSVDDRLMRALSEEPSCISEIFESTLGTVMRSLTAELGEDRSRWIWGAHNVAQFYHVAATHLGDHEWTTIGPLPKSGGPETVGLATPAVATGRQTTGASFRVIIDVGDWDRSLAVNTPGQSGDPRSPHYRDLFPLWQQDRYFPLNYSMAAVEAAEEQRWSLNPY